VQHFKDMRPLDVAIHAGQIYVGGRGNNGRGVLWGPPSGEISAADSQQHNNSLPKQLPKQKISPIDSQQQLSNLKNLETVLTNQATYTDGNAQDVLAKALLPVAMADKPDVGQQLTGYLEKPLPVELARLFEGNATASATHVMQWYVLWAMGLNGHGQVPLEILQAPWTEPANDREKYWHPAPAAAWTAARLGQDDEATLAAIIERLTTQDDPRWLVGDFVGALHTLTGEQFGYDVVAWQQWWNDQREGSA
jgi:hypothetical protein